MSRQILAITTCRVSTPEQEENNSLGRQEEAVLRAAKDLGAVIPPDGQWSGSVSSKAGTNIHRKDLNEMLAYCKKHPLVKYLIVHEVDRFMRSVDELFYFEVCFREQVGVKIIYASQPELNTDDYQAKLFKALKAFEGEVSNVERQKKSIDGHISALKEGRYTFSPKPGYMRGYHKGVQEIHPERGPALRSVLVRIAERQVTPTEGLIELNKSAYAKTRAPLKMDKFRHMLEDPFYAGIVCIDKQVKYQNENGLHEPLITKRQHMELVKIIRSKPKTQSGPRKNGNPKYPLSNLVSCSNCVEKRYGRFVGYDHGNGKSKTLVYEKYRCRSCKRYFTRDSMHSMVESELSAHRLGDSGRKKLLKALEVVWRQQASQDVQDINRLRHSIGSLNDSISNQVEAVTDPSNVSIKDDILRAIAEKRAR